MQNRERSEQQNNIFNIKKANQDEAIKIIGDERGQPYNASVLPSFGSNPIDRILKDQQDGKIQNDWDAFVKENINFNNFANQINPRPQSKLSNDNKYQVNLKYSPLKINPKEEQKNANTSSNDQDISNSKTKKTKTKQPKIKLRGELYRQTRMLGFYNIKDYLAYFSQENKADRIKKQIELYKKAIEESEKKLKELQEETKDKSSNNVEMTKDLIYQNFFNKYKTTKKYKGFSLCCNHENRLLPIKSTANQKYIEKHWADFENQQKKLEKVLEACRKRHQEKTKKDNMLNEKKNTENNNNTISKDEDKLTQSKNKSKEKSRLHMAVYPIKNIMQLLGIVLNEKIESKSREKEQNLNEEGKENINKEKQKLNEKQKENIFKQTINDLLSSNLLDILIEKNIDNAMQNTQQKEERKEIEEEEEIEEVKEEEKTITNNTKNTTILNINEKTNNNTKTLKRSKSILGDFFKTQTLEQITNKKEHTDLEKRQTQADKRKRPSTAKTKPIPNINQTKQITNINAHTDKTIKQKEHSQTITEKVKEYPRIGTSNHKTASQGSKKNDIKETTIIPKIPRPKTASQGNKKKGIIKNIMPQLTITLKPGNNTAHKDSKKNDIKETTTIPKIPKTEITSKDSKKEGITKNITSQSTNGKCTNNTKLINNNTKDYDEKVMDKLYSDYLDKAKNPEEQREKEMNEQQLKQREKEILSRGRHKKKQITLPNTKLPKNTGSQFMQNDQELLKRVTAEHKNKETQDEYEKHKLQKSNKKYQDLKKQMEKAVKQKEEEEKRKKQDEEEKQKKEEVNNQLQENNEKNNENKEEIDLKEVKEQNKDDKIESNENSKNANTQQIKEQQSDVKPKIILSTIKRGGSVSKNTNQNYTNKNQIYERHKKLLQDMYTNKDQNQHVNNENGDNVNLSQASGNSNDQSISSDGHF